MSFVVFPDKYRHINILWGMPIFEHKHPQIDILSKHCYNKVKLSTWQSDHVFILDDLNINHLDQNAMYGEWVY